MAPNGDLDGDGILNQHEFVGDTDGDTLINELDNDDDGDGILTQFEAADPNADGDDADAQDTDSDLTPDYLDNNDDNDALLTSAENPDPNADGNPADAQDSDGDTVPDYLDANDADGPNGDLDGDGIFNQHEFVGDTDGDSLINELDADDDGDGVLTIFEGADPNADGDDADAQDTDGDLTPDYLDNNDDGDALLTSAENPDPNADGNPSDAQDSDGDAVPDYLDANDADGPNGDLDGDGIWNQHEFVGDTDGDTLINELDADDDGDGVLTIFEGADPNADGDDADAQDTDSDLTPDYLDNNDDNDALLTSAENPDPNADGNPADAQDSDGDTVPDYLDANDLDGPNGDLDGDGIFNQHEFVGDTDGDTLINELDNDDDGDGIPTASENADPNDDGLPRDAVDSDHDGQPDYLDAPTAPTDGTVANEQKISDTSGGFTATLADSDGFGRATAGLGDLDSDGVNDIAVGALNDDDGGANRGAVYILFLNANGTVKAEQKISSTQGNLTATLNDADQFGTSVTGIGDIDADGVPDIAVGVRRDDDGGTDRGAVYILFLNPNGTVKAEQKISNTQGNLTATLNDSDQLGSALINLGDLDGDGVNDIAVGAYGDDDGGTDRGAVYILFLNANGTVKAEQKISSTQGGLTATLDDNDEMGFSMAALGDVDGDGVADLAVDSRLDDDGGANRGAVYILFLNANGTVKAEQKISNTQGNLTATLDDNDQFGGSLAGPGDLDVDGTADIAVGAWNDDDGGANRGAVYVLFLNPNGTVKAEQKISNTQGNLTATLDNSDQFGTSLASIGDLDGDGTPGVAIAAKGDDDGGTDRGAVYILNLAAVVGNSIAQGVADIETTTQDVGVIIDPSSNDTDINLDTIDEIDVTVPTNGVVLDNGDGTFTYVPIPAFTGADTFDYWAIDTGAGLTNFWGLNGNGADPVGGAGGVLTGTTTVTANFGDGLSFNEISDHVTAPDVTYGAEATIAFDFRINDNTGTLFQYVYSHDDINNFNSINIFITEASHGSDSNVLRTVARDGNDTLDNLALQFDISSLVGDSQWHTYAMTVHPITGITVWLDGVAQMSDPTRGTDGIDPTGPLYFGTREDLVADRFYGGELDSVQIYGPRTQRHRTH